MSDRGFENKGHRHTNTGGGGGRPMGGDSFDTAFLSTFLIVAVMMGTIDLYLV